MFLEHVNLTVANIERSIDFYTKLLDLKLRWRGETSEGHPAAHIGDDRFYLALFQGDPEGTAPAMDYAKVGFNHLGFVVDDLAETKTRLGRLGGHPHFEPEYVPGKRLYFLDPDGIEVELVEYASQEEALCSKGQITS